MRLMTRAAQAGQQGLAIHSMSGGDQQAKLQGRLPNGTFSAQLQVTIVTCKGESEVIRPSSFLREARNRDFYVKPQFLNVA